MKEVIRCKDCRYWQHVNSGGYCGNVGNVDNRVLRSTDWLQAINADGVVIESKIGTGPEFGCIHGQLVPIVANH